MMSPKVEIGNENYIQAGTLKQEIIMRITVSVLSAPES